MELVISMKLRDGMTRDELFIAVLESGRAAALSCCEGGAPEVDVEQRQLHLAQWKAVSPANRVEELTLYRTE